jgi:hypothetical protein
MNRTYFSKGCRGSVVVRLQRALEAQNFAPPALVKFTDGDFGGKTEAALRTAQKAKGLPETGKVDEPTWTAVTQTAIPTVFERALQLTADFEGHGFELAQGNFDGAGITWGIIGFTLKHGELKRVLDEVETRSPGKVDAAFGDLAPVWHQVMGKPLAAQIAWADSLSLGANKAALAPAWRQAFARLGALAVTQSVQVDFAFRDYFQPAILSAQRLGLATERGIALCFDTHVQSGGVKQAVFDAAKNFPANATEGDRLALISKVIADGVNPTYHDDVLSRRMCIATGAGKVHGAQYDVSSWGVGMFPA